VRRAAHTLKSNGATFGATRFSELFRELEVLAKAGDLTAAPALSIRIEEEYALLPRSCIDERERRSHPRRRPTTA
jgi:HPt (histidine-containing phosphotransfer) domain-containing protein